MIKLFFIPVILLLVFSCLRTKSNPSEPNIVIIMADDLGYGDLSCYGNENTKTPNIDFLATQGIRFTDFHSNGSVCSPTRAALMTGKYPQRTGVEAVITARSHREVGMSINEITLADELKRHGYNCGMFGKWHLGYAPEFNPTLQGFDEFVGFVSGNVDYHAHIDQEGFLDWWKGLAIENEEGYSTDLITKYGVNFIEENDPRTSKTPFFLYLPHEAPHGPFQRREDQVLRTVGVAGSKPVNKDSIASIYKEMVEVMDEGIGRIIEALKATDQYDNTIIVFLSDNGASHQGSNGLLRGFKAGVYEGGSRVPAIISYPGNIKKGVISDQPLTTMDLLPTLMDLIGQKPSSQNLDGISAKNHLLRQSNLSQRDLYFAYKNKSFIRSGNWKLVHIVKDQENHIELYDLTSDLQEKNDISMDFPELRNEMFEKLTMWKKQVKKDVEMVSE